MNNAIVVVGSSNTDMVVRTPRFPQAGETIIGGDFFVFQGGKGANQAVAAARAGGSVAFVCKVGNDSFGNNALQAYASEGIDISAAVKDETAATGTAVITINQQGENTIIVSSGANALLSVKDVENAAHLLQNCRYLLTQLETPLPVIEYLAHYCTQHQAKLILNPAPAAQLPQHIYRNLFLITPNQTETGLLTGIEVGDEASAATAASVFMDRGVRNVIITMGAQGAYVHTQSFCGLIPAPRVTVEDTTAAGDVFNGALTVALAEGRQWQEAVAFAAAAAAISVTKMGAQNSAPNRQQIDGFRAAPQPSSTTLM